MNFLSSLMLALVMVLMPGCAEAKKSAASDLPTLDTSWGVQTVNLASGRKYFVLLPQCGTNCSARELVIYSHGADAPEDVLNAGLKLKQLRGYSPETIFAYSVSKNGTKKFDVGVNYCCTFVDTQEITYLADLTVSVASLNPLTETSLMGVSNGGMLSERGECLMSEFFDAAASWAGTWRPDEGCDHGIVNIEQWHGTADPVVPIDGGTVHLWGRDIEVPPAANLVNHILPESYFFLHRIEGEDHVPSGPILEEMTRWVVAR